MSIRTSLIGGAGASAVGAALGGTIALIQGSEHGLWLYAAVGAAILSGVAWRAARRRVI